MRGKPSAMHPLLAAACTASAGLSLMALEICVPRLLAPAFGSGTIVWSTVIAAFMLGMAAGAVFGGRLSHFRRRIGVLLGLAATATATVGVAAGPAAMWTSTRFSPTPGAQLTALLIVCAVLLVPCGLLQASVFPLCLRACTPTVERTGRVYGTLYAASAAGSLAGVLLPPLLLIGLVGTRASVLVSCVPALVCAGLLAADLGGATVLTALAGAAAWATSANPTPTAWESAYGRYAVIERGDERLLQVDERLCYSVYTPGMTITGHYFDGYLAAPRLASAMAPRRIAVIGTAGGTVLHLFRAAWPRAEIRAVDLDAGLIAAAHREFGVDLEIECADGRCWLRQAGGDFDIIAVDTMTTGTPPIHMMSREFFTECLNRLSPSGVVVVNALPPLDGPVAATMAEAAPHAALLENLVVGARVPLVADRLADAAPWAAWPARAARLQDALRPPPRLTSIGDDDSGLPWWWGLRVEP